jgi:hypothetical protein
MENPGFVLLIMLALFILPAVGGITTGINSQRTKRRRMEMLHLERMAALEKGVPLPELPALDQPPRPSSGFLRGVTLVWGIIFLCGGVGSMIALLLTSASELSRYWTLPMPVAFVGVGLLIYHFLARERGN